MKMNTSDFWDLNYYNHPPLTEYMINLAERLLNVQLPGLFVELLKVQNGGFTKGFAFPMNEKAKWTGSYISLSELFGIVTDENIWTAQNILDSRYMAQEWGLPEKQILLAIDKGPRYITLDYRNGNIPSVRWIDLEYNEDIQIANSFEDFINGLVFQGKICR
ncbi:MAG: SMI1/KNR4 family protein [Chitinophagaceae bacterium]|nr:SMI1/KNR4 family protein [Chitinophagaceae bacterium]MCW5929425.1 SMI1/KNR4 family protein [Chitinophagaceae bacterium]